MLIDEMLKTLYTVTAVRILPSGNVAGEDQPQPTNEGKSLTHTIRPRKLLVK